MEIYSSLSVLLGASWLSGFNAYATIGFLGLFGRLGWLTLPNGLATLEHPAVFGIALALYLIEFIADKVPAIDSLWDSIQTFIRVPAGAILAFAAVGDVAPELKLLATMLGGGLALSAHATKSSIRALVNLSPEPFSNWMLSLGQDGALLLLIWVMFYFPIFMLGILLLFLILFIWFMPKIFRTFGRLFGRRVQKPSDSSLPA